jgi:hypothetical protein
MVKLRVLKSGFSDDTFTITWLPLLMRTVAGSTDEVTVNYCLQTKNDEAG